MNVSVWEVSIRIYNTDLEPVIRALHEDSRQGGRVQIVLTKLKRGDRCVRRNPGAVFQHLKIKRKCVKLIVLAFPDRPQYHHVRSVSTITQCRLQYDPDLRLCQPPFPLPSNTGCTCKRLDDVEVHSNGSSRLFTLGPAVHAEGAGALQVCMTTASGALWVPSVQSPALSLRTWFPFARTITKARGSHVSIRRNI